MRAPGLLRQHQLFCSKIGALVQAVEEMGQLDDNMSIVTADHGDMLGEKGL